MKKIYIITASLAVLLFLLIGGSILVDRQFEKDPTFMSRYIDFDYSTSSGSSSNKNSYTDMEITGKEAKAKNISKISDHETIHTNIGDIKVDAGLSDEEWEARIGKGLTEKNFNEADEYCSKRFYYSRMDESLKQLYLEIYIVLTNHVESFYICSVSPSDIDYAFNCVMGDHPEIFYVNGYLYTKYTADGSIIKIEFNPGYTMSHSKAVECMNYVDQYRFAFLKGINENASEYDKVRYTYEFVIYNTEYDIESVENQNILSVFMYGKSVCQGYAKAFQYLASALDIQSALVVGTVGNDEGHAWNIVRCNSEYYYIDCTWGDSSYLQNSTSLNQYGINYDYLNITTKELEVNHVIDNFAILPTCVSTRDNYYVKEGLYFNTIDEDRIALAFAKALASGKESVEIKCANTGVFYRMGEYLLDENHVFDYLPSDIQTLTYMKNQDLNIYSFPLY
ncbi:MAG: hypothetical protein K6G75_09795 [Lachnospiraceae bacterium]|nr:hypothetical protein [Lachnospiraceae bacterium]